MRLAAMLALAGLAFGVGRLRERRLGGALAITSGGRFVGAVRVGE